MNTKTPQTVKAKIHITFQDNHKYFWGKLPTKRWGFCEITRTVVIEPDPHGIYELGNYGYIIIGGQKVRVINSGSNEVLFELR